MDVSNLLASHAAKFQSIAVEKDTAMEVDTGFLTVTDVNVLDEESYQANLEEHLMSLARDGIQTLMTSLFSLPTRHSPDGPLAQLPPPTHHLPRSKRLPTPAPPTKWEKFAAAKGIQKKIHDKKEWDEEKQEWVNRWGRDGKNKGKEVAWITEVPLNADIDHDPRKIARSERKERVTKNEKKHAQNIARAAGTPFDERKREVEMTLARTQMSTASMGKFDKHLVGEKKVRGLKRKFDPTEAPIEQEKNSAIALLSRMESDSKKTQREPQVEESVLNVRKAVRFATKIHGAASGKETSHVRGRGGRGRGGRGRKR